MNNIINYNEINKTNVKIDEYMSISLADFLRKQELADLWIEAFEDDEKFISSFIDAYMIPEYNVPVVIDTKNNKIISAFYLIEFELYSNMQSLGMCAYLFAAATKKDYRNKGYMSKLIEYAVDLCKNRGLKGIFLFPQNNDLFDFYAKYKFKSIYQMKKIIINSSDYKNSENIDFSHFSQFRLQNHIITDTKVFDGLYKSYEEFTAKQDLSPLKDRLFYFKCASSYLEWGENSRYFGVFENNVEKFCYVFYKKDKTKYYIDDIIIPEYNKIRENIHKKFEEIISLLTGYILSSGDNIQIEMNVPALSFTDEKNIRTAMILPLSKDVTEIAKNLKSPVYLNMFMNL